jgi:cell division protein FtsB
MSKEDLTSKKPQDGEGKALIRERQKVKRLEETLDKKRQEIERLEQENERLRKHNEKLKAEMIRFPLPRNGIRNPGSALKR